VILILNKLIITDHSHHEVLLLSYAAAAMLAVAAVVGLLYAVPTHSLLARRNGRCNCNYPKATGERTIGRTDERTDTHRCCNFHFKAGSVLSF
jgi:hypothetical protein